MEMNCIGNVCPFVEKKKKALCLVQHISTKKPPTLLFQPRPTPLLLIIITMSTPHYSNPSSYSGLESTPKNIFNRKVEFKLQ